MINQSLMAVKITHIPTNFSIIITRNDYRISMKSLVDLAKKVFGIRLLAQQETLLDVYEYDLPEGQEYPHELMKYRKKLS